MDTSVRKKHISQELIRVREKTLSLLQFVAREFWNVRVHDFYSPIGWHFGHIGMTEEQWTGVRALGGRPQDDRLSFLFANLPDNPKDDRVHLPSPADVVSYLGATRETALSALGRADIACADPLLADGYAWEFALQHECQHQETIAEMLQLIRSRQSQERPGELVFADRADWYNPPDRTDSSCQAPSPMEVIPGGCFLMGSDERHGYDNEKAAHIVEVAPFQLDVSPVTAGDWMGFMRSGGYRRPEYWSAEGYAWAVRECVEHPEYWLALDDGYGYFAADGIREIDPFEPVTSISWYEADAFARWAGKRLPTEAEWEYAAAYDPKLRRMRRFPWGDQAGGARDANCQMRGWQPMPVDRSAVNAFGLYGMAGGAWEWTASPFLPYPGFEAFPYDGYSKEHMDGKHFVCRGGSWATDRRILRASFRNWYVPTYRQGFLGLRCAR